MLEVVDVHKKYGERVALAGVSLRVAAGETVVVMGPSGCGKSTLLRCINRLTTPDRGDVLVDGRSVMAMDDDEVLLLRRQIGFVFQHFHLIRRLSVLVSEVLDVMEELARERSTAMLVVTHEMRFALSAADRIVMMDRGRVVEEGPPERVFSAPRSDVARRYAQLLVR